MKNIIFDIQRFCVKDGPGIRTTVFLKGCPLNCDWCHNPESKNSKPTLAFNSEKCIRCGKCKENCSKKAILQVGVIDRERCNLCGDCISLCTGALEIWGQETTCEQVLEEVLKDKSF